MPAPPPQLLVSVRSPAEALAAAAGGCDLIDVKEPSRGPLGAADVETIAAVCDVARDLAPLPLSVALGELREWPETRAVPALPSGVSFAKLGLAGCGADPSWVARWRALRHRFDAAANRDLGWIAVLYADSMADSPPAEGLIDLAATTRCRGLLIDTYSKESGRLFDHVSPRKLAEWRSTAGAAGLLFAVAGSLRAADLPALHGVEPDIVAVRGAACLAGERTAAIDSDAVRLLKVALADEVTFAGAPAR